MSENTKRIRVLRGGRITIPSIFRAKLGIDHTTLLLISVVGQELRIRPMQLIGSRQNPAWTHELYGLFAPVRKEAARHSEKDVDAEIDRAITLVRRKRRSRRG